MTISRQTSPVSYFAERSHSISCDRSEREAQAASQPDPALYQLTSRPIPPPYLPEIHSLPYCPHFDEQARGWNIQKGQDAPLAVYLCAAEDWNRAFDFRCARMKASLESIRETHYVVRIELNRANVKEACQKARELAKNRRIRLVYFAAHGTPEYMEFSSRRSGHYRRSDVSPEDFSLVEPSAIYVLNSCSTGASKGIAKTISRAVPKSPLLAPREAIIASIIYFSRGSTHCLNLSEDYRDVTQLYLGGNSVDYDCDTVSLTRDCFTAESGSGLAILGDFHRCNKERPINRLAALCYLKSAVLRLPEAQSRLGDCYKVGIGVQADSKEAFAWYKKAALQGDPSAQYNLGVCYQTGIGVEPDAQEAFKWYQKAALQGKPFAQCSLGFCYQKGIGVEPDAQEAFKWYQKAALQGAPSAQSNLGFCFQKGIGVEPDAREAFKWYEKAALQGDSSAQYNLGVCYQTGFGVEPDAQEAFKWYQKAALQGNALAQLYLGVCYQDGIGVDRDVQEAFRWYEKAALQGQAEAQNVLKKRCQKQNFDAVFFLVSFLYIVSVLLDFLEKSVFRS